MPRSVDRKPGSQMAKKDKIALLVSEVEQQLSDFHETYAGLTWREKVLRLASILGTVRKLGANAHSLASDVNARERIRLYLTEHTGVIIDGTELEVVSGISEYGRRVRELRVEEGYKILTGQSRDPDAGLVLTPKQYVMLDPNPDRAAARRWHVANRIRRQPEGGSKGRVLRYLLENVGQVITSEELRYVARAGEFGRRVRELRTEEGYAVATHYTGRPDLRMGEYVLESSDRIAEPHDRQIPVEVQKQVYERDDNTCRVCWISFG